MSGGLFAVRQAVPRYEYAYNANGQVAYVRNNLLGQIAQSEYDLSNRPCRVTTHKFTEDEAGNLTGLEHVYTGEVAYDDTFGRLSEFNEKVGADREEFVTTFGYDDENRPTSLEYGDFGESTLEYDGLGRVAKATVKAGDGTANTTTYTYVAGAALEDEPDMTSTTGLVQSISQTGGNFTYTYDDNGNIASVVQDGVTTSYTYDALGQLVQVDDGHENCTWAYTYDQGGNILTKKKFVNGVETESMTFTYGNSGWKDQLTAVDGVAITYDKIGNPLSDGEWTYTWENGRQLKRMQSVDIDASFIYNENGLRVQKTVNEVVTKYILHGKNIVHMTSGSDELHFFYDAQNKPAVVVYNGTPYSYVKNLQGDIVALLDNTGAAVVAYKYDAWGRPISKTGTLASTLGTVQPFRYRGYVYDEETGLYYLRSRYYNPKHCRFINADCLLNDGILNTNQQTYCVNNPVMLTDGSGRDWGTEDYNNLLPGCDFVNIGGCYQVNIPPEAVWSSVYATPLYSGMWSSGLVGPSAGDIFNLCTISKPYTESKIYDPKNTKRGWKPGENIFNQTLKGDFPSWTTIRNRFWKNEYFYHKENYSPANQLLIKNGLAPLDKYGNPYHLHHPNGREGDNYFIFGPVDPIKHRDIHTK